MMKKPESAAYESGPPRAAEGRRGRPRLRLRIWLAAAGLLGLILGLAAWFYIRFDVLGRAGAAFDRQEYRITRYVRRTITSGTSPTIAGPR